MVDNCAKYTGFINPKKNIWYFGNPLDYKNFTFIKQDCRNFFKKNHYEYYDYVLHLAAIVGGREIIENNPLAVAEDLSIDSSFWSWASKSKPKKVICFSSSASYPIHFQKKNNFKLLKESMISFNKEIGVPDMTYGWSKLTCEYLAKIAFEKHNIKSVVYRPFSGYGEDQHKNYPFTGIIDRAINNKNKKIFKVWGSGNQMRDFIHIDDCVKGVIKTMNKINDSSALNLSTGKLLSFKTLAKKICNQIGYNPEIIGTNNKPEGVFARGGCTLKQEKYGFKHQLNIDEGISSSLKYKLN